MNHSKTLLLLVLVVPGCLAAQQQLIQRHWPAQLSPPLAAGDMQLELVFGRHRLQLQLQQNTALLAQFPEQLRSSLKRQGARYFEGHVRGVENSWLRLSWLQGADGR